MRKSRSKPANYVDYLRGDQTFSTFPSMNSMQRDIAMMNGKFITESRYIMLLTLDEAQDVLNELLGRIDKFFSYKAGPGNIKDGLDGFRTLSRLTTYNNGVGNLIFNFRSLSIRAIKYSHNGIDHIKITGYPAMRRILNGTRYSLRNPQILEMAIGMRGLAGSIIKGTKFCICCSLSWRAVELIFKSDYQIVDFLVDVTMDVAKAIVAGVVILVVGGFLTLATAPVVFTISLVIGIGILLNIQLNNLDDEFHLSANLKVKLHNALSEEHRMREWNQLHSSTLFNFLANTSD